jgi:hypothetical protein
MFGIDDIVGAGIKVVGNIIDKVWPDPEKAAAAKLELLKMQQAGELAELNSSTQLALAQIGVNNTEATNPSMFVAGWRPFTGWVCSGGLAYTIVVYPIITAVTAHWIPGFEMPKIDVTDLLLILGGMLGINGISRSVEKVKGVDTSSIGNAKK